MIIISSVIIGLLHTGVIISSMHSQLFLTIVLIVLSVFKGYGIYSDIQESAEEADRKEKMLKEKAEKMLKEKAEKMLKEQKAATIIQTVWRRRREKYEDEKNMKKRNAMRKALVQKKKKMELEEAVKAANAAKADRQRMMETNNLREGNAKVSPHTQQTQYTIDEITKQTPEVITEMFNRIVSFFEFSDTFPWAKLMVLFYYINIENVKSVLQTPPFIEEVNKSLNNLIKKVKENVNFGKVSDPNRLHFSEFNTSADYTTENYRKFSKNFKKDLDLIPKNGVTQLSFPSEAGTRKDGLSGFLGELNEKIIANWTELNT